MEKPPRFKNAEEEAGFWETHSPLEFPGEFEQVKEPVVDRRGRKGIPGKPRKEARCPSP